MQRNIQNQFQRINFKLQKIKETLKSDANMIFKFVMFF